MDNVSQSLQLLVIGMSVTLVVLSVVAFFVIRRIRSHADTVNMHHGDADLNDETVAVLAAAATIMLKRPVSVRRVRFLVPAAEPAWAVTGRLNIMASHAISRRKSQS